MKRLLLIEDDENICQLISHLFKEKYDVTVKNSGTEGLLAISQNTYDLVLLDLMLPGITGESVLQTVRKTSDVPIIILTAIDNKEKTVELLRNGANDYLTKPFHIEELEARIEIHLLQTRVKEVQTLVHKKLSLDTELLEATVQGERLTISNKEFQVLELLLRHPNKIYSKANLYETIWQDAYIGGENTINVHISSLRKKLKELDPEEEYIETIWGTGIRLSKEA
ncbi:response regulator transcription factor [Isobaculum melis]|uniref:DNA-binding response regulator, OmpR family, contains REC and winged-helix (WHTH) domain n=1 Tax=Isobaculum melis TaxID=142588 RepID=A0A1H9U5U8_9LACT|nr:response regulator transcription factor [Isobaculum melis]SES04537.1 DNA-binding response regulator, OmpR family, contains REC and winged-helix (wHTH) domain [Isobaculum melis]